MPVPNQKRFNVVLDRKHDRVLDRLAEQQQKSRSAVIRDAIDRMATPIPDVESDSGTHPPK